MTKAFLLKTTTQDVIDDVDVFTDGTITAAKLNGTVFTLPISGGGHVYLGANDPANVVLTTDDTAAYLKGLKPKGVVYTAAFMNAPADFGFSWSSGDAGTLTIAADLAGMLSGLQVGDKVLFNFAVTTPEYSGIYTYQGYSAPNSTLIRATNFNETAEVVVGSFVTSVTGSVSPSYPAGHGFFIRTLDPLFDLNDPDHGAIAFEHWGKDSAFSYTEGDGVNIVVDGGGAQEISLDTAYPLAGVGGGAIGLNYSAPLTVPNSGPDADKLTVLAATNSVNGTLSSADFTTLAAFATAGKVHTDSAASTSYAITLPDLAVSTIAVNQVRVVMRSTEVYVDPVNVPNTNHVGVLTLTCTTKRGASGAVSLLDATISANQYYLKLDGGTSVLKDLAVTFAAGATDPESQLSVALPAAWTVAIKSAVIQKVQSVA